MKWTLYIVLSVFALTANVVIVCAQNDDICGGIYLNPRCSVNGYYTYSNNGATGSTQANPGCANYQGGDVWFKTVAPHSGKLRIVTRPGVVWDGGMTIYKATSCNGALSLLKCEDSSPSDFMPEINLQGLTPGDSLFIRFWEAGNDVQGSFEIAVHDPNPTYCMVGDATPIFPGDCIQLTKSGYTNMSAVWSTNQINLNNAFDYTFQVNLGSNDATGADGITFIMQNNPAGLTAIGAGGSDLGIGAFPKSFIVEFDTYDNGAPDISSDHIAMVENGNFAAPVVAPIRASFLSGNIEDGNYHNVRITWNPSTMVYRVYFDGILRLSYTRNLIANVFGGNPVVYWGFTGSTGFYSNNQSICPGGLPLPVTWVNFTAYRQSNLIWLEWVTSEEKDTKEFAVERSADGVDFTTIGSVPASGNSSSLLSYHYQDLQPASGVSYYRLRQIDIDDSYSFSPVVTVGMNGDQPFSFEIYPNPVRPQGEISIDIFSSEPMESKLSILNSLGQILHTQTLPDGKNILSLPSTLEPGPYTVLLKNTKGSFVEKIIIY